MSSIAAIILAAGRSSRFEDGNKLLADCAGEAMVRRVALAVSASPVDDIILVTGPDDGSVLHAAGTGRWRSILNPQPSRGLSSSLKAGLVALRPNTCGALVVLADMPAVPASLIAKLCAAFEAQEAKSIVFPRNAEGLQGNPVLWPRAIFPDLMQLDGDNGGKRLLTTHAHLCHPLDVSDDGAFTDIDTRADLARLERSAG